MHDSQKTSLSTETILFLRLEIVENSISLPNKQNFQERKENLAIIVDEYGEVEGLVTLQDIIEEFVGEFTTNNPEFYSQPVAWNLEGDAIIDGLTSIRELNRNLGLNLPTNGPRTLNGLILETLEDLPEANLSLRIHNLAIEILTVQGQLIKKVRLRKPKLSPNEKQQLKINKID